MCSSLLVKSCRSLTKIYVDFDDAEVEEPEVPAPFGFSVDFQLFLLCYECFQKGRGART